MAASQTTAYVHKNGDAELANVSVSGTLDVTGTLTPTGNLALTGNATVGGTLGVTGATTLTGNTTVGGTFGVTGASTLTGNTTVGGTFGVTGATTLSSTLAAGASTLASATVTGAATVGTTLGVTGASTLTGNTTVGGTLGVTGATTLSSTLAAGATTLASATVTGAATVGTTLGVTGDIDAGGGFRKTFGPYLQDNVSASQTGVRLALGATGNPQQDLVASRAGSLVAITASFTVAPAGSTLTLQVYKNGALMHASAALSVPAGATLGHYAVFAKDTADLLVAAGDRIGVAITTDGSWTATTSDVAVMVEIEG